MSIGFLFQGSCIPLIPKILASYEKVEIKRNHYERLPGILVNRLVEEVKRPVNGRFKVLLLSHTDAGETLRIAAPIPNDKVSKTEKITAYTMGQRYASMEKLLKAKTTSDLD